MIRIIILTLISVFILTFIGEMIHGYATCLLNHTYHDTIFEYLLNSFINIRWENVTSNLFISGFSILMCLRFFDQLSYKK